MHIIRSRNKQGFIFTCLISIILVFALVLEPPFARLAMAQTDISTKFPYTKEQLDKLADSLTSLSIIAGYGIVVSLEFPPAAIFFEAIGFVASAGGLAVTIAEEVVYRDPKDDSLSIIKKIATKFLLRYAKKLPGFITVAEEEDLVEDLIEAAVDKLFDTAISNVENAEPTAEKPPAPQLCENTPVSRLVIGEQGRVTPGLGTNNVRNEPTLSGTKIGQILEAGTFTVMDGPVCADGFAWWQVNYNGLIGWTAEGKGNEYWLEPLVENTTTDIRKDIIGSWDNGESPDTLTYNYITFSADGTFYFPQFESEITGTYIFVTDNRIKLNGKICDASGPCGSVTYEVEVAINGNILSLSFSPGKYEIWQRAK